MFLHKSTNSYYFNNAIHVFLVDAVWSKWTVWSGCDKPCNDGKISRTRYCSRAMFGGVKECLGNGIQAKQCNSNKCPSKIIYSLLFSVVTHGW